MDIITRKEAKHIGLKYYFTGILCCNGHIEKRRVSNRACVVCSRQRTNIWKYKNPEAAKKWNIEHAERKRELDRVWRLKNVKRKSQTNNKWRQSNKERCAHNLRQWRCKNPQLVALQRERSYLINAVTHRKCTENWRKDNKEHISIIRQTYRKSNRGLINAHNALRRAARRNASPNWLTQDMKREIFAVFERAQLRTIETGIIHHVDHIVPLRGKNVCGLHVPWNLQILTEEENLRKSNGFF